MLPLILILISKLNTGFTTLDFMIKLLLNFFVWIAETGIQKFITFKCKTTRHIDKYRTAREKRYFNIRV